VRKPGADRDRNRSCAPELAEEKADHAGAPPRNKSGNVERSGKGKHPAAQDARDLMSRQRRQPSLLQLEALLAA
jgi:hypothetical protein